MSENKHYCKPCKKSFKQKSHYIAHQTSSVCKLNKDKNYQCTHCDFVSSTKNALTFHLKKCGNEHSIVMDVNKKTSSVLDTNNSINIDKITTNILDTNNSTDINKIASNITDTNDIIIIKKDLELEKYKLIIDEREKFKKELELEREKFIKEISLERERSIKKEEELKKENREKLEKVEKEKMMLFNKLDQLTNKASTNITNINNNLSYLNKNYNTAKPLETIDFKDYKNKEDTSEKIVDKIITSYYKNKIHKELGDLIIENYKNEDKTQQSLWSLDVARLKYAVREHFDKKNKTKTKAKWIYDHNANLIKEKIIQPLFKCIHTIIQDVAEIFTQPYLEKQCIKKLMKEFKLKKNDAFVKYKGSNYENEVNDKFENVIRPKINDLHNIGVIMRNGDLESKICKYITPFFKLDDDNLLENDDNLIEQ